MTQAPQAAPALMERLQWLKTTQDEQIASLCKDHTKAELARIVVAGRIQHAERDIAEAGTQLPSGDAT